MNPQKLAKLQAGVRIGGTGSMRRKKKAKRNRNNTTDEKRLMSTLKRIGVQQIPGIEEINFFKMDGTVIHFKTPKFQASGTANTYVVSGKAEHKKIQDLLPGILEQLPNAGGGANMAQLAEAFKSGLGGTGGGRGGGDDDIPDLVENFDVAAAEKADAKITEIKEDTKGGDQESTPNKEAETSPAPAEGKSAEVESENKGST